jgi:hypothetical protein
MRSLSPVMKKAQGLTIVAIFASLVLSSQGQDYEYQFTAPIIGGFQQGAADPNLEWRGIGYGFSFGTLSETAYYNPTANTLDQIGSFTLSATEFSGSFQDNQEIPHSTTVVPATVSVVYILNGGNNTVSFNSGFLPVGENPAMNWSIPFTESITVTTGGQNYTDVLSGSIPEANTITSISQFSPESIVISQGYSSVSQNIFNPALRDQVIATDGWSENIYDAIGDGYLGETYNVSPVTASAVPEPGALILFPVGAIGLIFILGRRSLKPHKIGRR